jgi:hypothetical protein
MPSFKQIQVGYEILKTVSRKKRVKKKTRNSIAADEILKAQSQPFVWQFASQKPVRIPVA